MTAAKEALGAAPELPSGFVDISTIPSETEVPCRTASNIPFIGPGGVFTGMTTTTRRIRQLFGSILVVTVDLTVSLLHIISPNVEVAGCSSRDGVTFLAATSKNLLGIDPQVTYIKSAQRVTNVKVSFAVRDETKPAVVGLKVKYEENVLNNQFNPKRKSGTITFP